MWKEGLSWSRGRWVITINPDGSTKELYISSGPFLFIRFNGIEFYAGFRPTPPWYRVGNEGLFPRIARWLKDHGWGNLGLALRRFK